MSQLQTATGSRPSEVNPRGFDVNVRSGPQSREYLAIADRIAADRPGRILDWGCGWGQVTNLLTERSLEVEAFDYDPDVQAETTRALELFPHITERVSPDPRRLPYDDGSFEAALSCGVLEHVEDPDASLDELRRVLRPGGTLYVYKLPNRFSYLERIAKLAGLYYHGKLQNDRVYTLASARALLERHGYVVREARRSNMLPLTLTGSFATRAAAPIWQLNRLLAAVPGLNLVSTNVELIARAR